MDPIAEDQTATESAATDRLREATPLGSTAAALTLIYVVWYIVDLVVLDRSPAAFNAVHRQLGGFVGRLVFVGIGLAVVFHALDGLRRALGDLSPRIARHDAGLRAVAGFVTFAVGLPVALVLLWPAVRAWAVR